MSLLWTEASVGVKVLSPQLPSFVGGCVVVDGTPSAFDLLWNE